MSQPIASPPGPEYGGVSEDFTWVGNFLGDGHAEILWGPSQVGGDVFTFYSLSGAGGRSFFMSRTDQEPQINRLDLGTRRTTVGWVGAFADAQHSSVLVFDVHTDDWWLLRGLPTGGIPKFTGSKVGNTTGFGHSIYDGRPFWSGDFDGDGLDEILFYFPGDGHWLLGNIVSNQLTWTLVGTTPFSTIGGGYRTWSGKFTQSKQSEVLFSLSSGAWLLFSLSGSQLVSHGVGSTAGFGNVNDGRPFWVGDFGGDGIDEMLFYYPGDDNWWMGRFFFTTPESATCSQLRKDIAQAQAAITQLKAEQSAAVLAKDYSALRTIAADITKEQNILAAKQAQFTQAGCAATAPPLFGQLVWKLVGNTIGYGHGLTSDGRPFWVGRFSQASKDEILFYYAPAGHWHRGKFDGSTIQWTLAGTTNVSGLGLSLFSNQGGHAWPGDFDGDGLTELVYRPTGSTDFWMFDFGVSVSGSKVYTRPVNVLTTTVPNVVGKGLAAAATAIQNASLQPNPVAFDSSTQNQIVVSQDPVGGATVQQGTRVNLGCVGNAVGVSTLHFVNCSDSRLHLWTSNDGDHTWNDEDYVDPPDSSTPSNCPSTDIAFDEKGPVDVVAVDSEAVPDVSPGDPAFNPGGIVFRALLPGDPSGTPISATKSS
jgi:hypothetical protein